MSNEELINKDREIEMQWIKGVNQMKMKEYGYAFTAFTKILKERYEYCQLQNSNMPFYQDIEREVAGLFLRKYIKGIPNPYYDQCIKVFEEDSKEHVDALIDLYDKSAATEYEQKDFHPRTGKNKFLDWKEHHGDFKIAIKKRNKDQYHLFSWDHWRVRNHLAHASKNASDSRDQQILVHMAHLMRNYAEQLKLTLTSE